MDHDEILSRMAEAIPLNAHLGIELLDVGDGTGRARLPFRPVVSNHLKMVHATAIFGLAEAASGCAVTGAFAPMIAEVRPIAGAAGIEYRHLARGDLTARAETAEPAATLRSRLEADGRVTFEVRVSVCNANEREVAGVTVTWTVDRRRRPAPA